MSDETVRLTYAEIAKARGITQAAAKRMAIRHRWPKQVGNDGLSRVQVPATLVRDTGGDTNGVSGVVAGAPQAFSLDEPRLRAAVAAGADTVSVLRETITDLRAELREAQERVAGLRAKVVAARYARELMAVELREARAQVARLTERLARRRWWGWRP